MSLNQVYDDATSLSVPVPEGTKSGKALLIGVLPAVAREDRRSDGEATCKFGGGFRLSVVGKEKEGKNKAIKVGEKVFIDAEGVLSADSEKTLFGYALEEVGSGKTVEVVVKIATP